MLKYLKQRTVAVMTLLSTFKARCSVRGVRLGSGTVCILGHILRACW